MDNSHDSNEPVAWYVERQHVGFRDHGLKYGPFWKLSEAEEWADCCHILKPLYTTQPKAQPEQEPVAWPVGWVDDGGTVFWKDKPPADGADLYTVIDKSAATRIATSLGWEPKRKPLTPDQVFAIADQHPVEGFDPEIMAFARAIEAAHGIKE